MVSAVASQQIASGLKIEMWDHDPDSTTANKIVTPDAGTTIRVRDMRDYKTFSVGAMTTVLGGNGITKLEIVAASNVTMTNDLTVIKDSGTVAADAQGDWVFLECTAEELAHEGKNLRYVAGRITVHHAGDEAAVVYISEPLHRIKDLTPSTTIS